MANPFSNQKARAPLPKRWFWIVMGCLLGVIAVSTYFNNLSVDARDARRFLRKMPVDQIREIRIERYTVSSLTDHVIVIRDRERIERERAIIVDVRVLDAKIH